MRGRKPSEKRILAAFESLRTLVRDHCIAIGGVPVPDDITSGVHSVNVIVPTCFGPLWVWGPHCSEFLAVFARFEDPARGARALANPHSGKWNYHSGSIREGHTPGLVFAAWVHDLNAIRGGTRAEIDAAIESERARMKRVREWHEQEKREEKGA